MSEYAKAVMWTNRKLPSYAELALYHDQNYPTLHETWFKAVMALYHSTGVGSVEVQAGVDQIPDMFISPATTYAILLAMGHKLPEYEFVIAKMMETRLSA